MTKKLFYVEVTKSAWVLAENEEEAEKFADEISDTEDHDIPTQGLDKLIKKLQHQMEEHK